MLSIPLVRYILTAARRDRLLITLLCMIAVSGAVSVFLGSAAITEKESFSLVFGSGALRFLGVIGLVLFVCFYVRRSFETKEVEFLLSRPISRMAFLFSHAAAFILLSFLVSAVIAGVVFFLGKPVISGMVLWGGSVFVELAIVVVAALFFSMVLTSAAGSALATLGFYVLARLMGTLLGIASQAAESPVFSALNSLMEAISVVIPRLDLMGQTSWLVYGVEGSAGLGGIDRGAYGQAMIDVLGPGGFFAAQGVLAVLLLIAAAAYDFSRREF